MEKREKARQYWFVVQQLTARELKRKYARSVLGVVWSVLNPLLSMAVLSLIFSQLFRRSIENYPIYYLTGYLLWQAFTATTNAAMTTLADNRALLLQVKFPMELFILTRGATALVNLGYSLVAYGVMLVVFQVPLRWTLAYLPVVVACLFLFALGISYLLSAAYVFFGDIKHLYSVALTLWMYCSAIFYPADQLSGFIRQVVGDNPHADGEMARAQGIVPMLYPGVHQAGGPYRARDMSAVVGSLYRGVVNGKLHNGSQAYSPLYEYGYVYGGLFALGYCRFIRAWAEHSGADRLLFLSRDGEALLALYRRLYPQDSRPVYAYWSRLAAAKVCAGLFPADYFRRFLWHRAGEGVPLGKLLRGMELTPLLPGLCGALGVFPQTPLTHKNAGAVQDYLQRAWGQVLKSYQPQVQAAGAYYRQLLAGCSHAGAVDIGWAGSGAVSLAAAAKHLWGLECRVTGLVAGTNSAHSPERDAAEPLLLTGDLVSYLFSQSHNRDLWKLHNPRQGHNLFWELLLGGEEGGLRGFSPGEETGWRLELGENSHSGAVGEIHRGLLDFAQDFTDLEKRLGLPLAISGRDAYAPMLEVLARRNAPYRRQWEALLDEPGIG